MEPETKVTTSDHESETATSATLAAKDRLILNSEEHSHAELPSKRPQPLPPTAKPKQIKILSSTETLKSNISDAESQLATKVQQLTLLKSFPPPPQQPAKTDTDVVTHVDKNLEHAALKHAKVIVDKQVTLLKRYNEIKDIALGMLSLIAEKEGKRLAEVMDERGLKEDD